MTKKLEKLFDEEFGNSPDGVDGKWIPDTTKSSDAKAVTWEDVKAFIDEHYVAKTEAGKGCREALDNLSWAHDKSFEKHLKTCVPKSQLLEIVGEDFHNSHVIGSAKAFTKGYNQRGAEIRKRIEAL